MRAFRSSFPAPTPPVAFSYPFRPSLAPGARVATAFREALDSAPLSELRAATLAFAATLKAEGVPPEKVLVSLKTALTHEGSWLSLFPACCPDQIPPTRAHQLYAQVFGWFLEGYFGPPRPRSAEGDSDVRHPSHEPWPHC